MKKLILLLWLFAASYAYSNSIQEQNIQVGKTMIHFIPPVGLTEITPEQDELYQSVVRYYEQDSDSKYYVYYLDFDYANKNSIFRLCTLSTTYPAMDLSVSIEQFKASQPDIQKGIWRMLSDPNVLNTARVNSQKQLDSNADTIGLKAISTKFTVPLMSLYNDDESALYFGQKEYVQELFNQQITEKESFSMGFVLLNKKIMAINCLSSDNDLEWSKQKLQEWSKQLVEINRPNIIFRLWDTFLYYLKENWLVRITFIWLLIHLGRKFFIKGKKNY